MPTKQENVKIEQPISNNHLAKSGGEPGSESDITYFERKKLLPSDIIRAKNEVARYVVDNFLQDGDPILLDAGTSNSLIAQVIAKKAQASPDSTHYTIMTHNYEAFQILIEQVPAKANMNIVLAGGRYDRDLNAFLGPQTITAYDNFFPRVVLIGVSGIVANLGIFCHGNTEELDVKKTIFSKFAVDRIIIADHSKIGKPDSFRFGKSDKFLADATRCILVTDPASDSDELAQLKNYKVDVHITGQKS